MTATAGRHARLPSFVGRRTELSSLGRLLRDNRLVLLLGPGGVGKTRLALAATEEYGRRWSQAWLVELGAVAEPALLEATIGAVLGLDGQDDANFVDLVGQLIGDRRPILVLDECEQLADSVGPLVDRLLRACPTLTVLATSRTRLGVPGEVVFTVQPLPTPASAAARNPGELDAVVLFLDRARRVRPDWSPTEAELAVVGEVVARLDGIPLAIELAAAWIALLSPAELLARLERRFELLVNRDRVSGRRHTSLEAAIESSYESLSAPARAAFRRLSMLPGGWTIEAMAAICELDPTGALEQLAELADRSLVSVVGGETTPTRYRMLDTLREFAAIRLHDEEGMAVARVAAIVVDYLRRLASESGAKLFGFEAADSLRRLDLELPNLLAALQLEFAELTVAQLEIADALKDYWALRGHYVEACTIVERLVGRRLPPSAIVADALNDLAFFRFAQGETALAVAASRRALAAARRSGSAASAVRARNQLAHTLVVAGRLGGAGWWATRALATVEGTSDPALVPLCHIRLAQVLVAQGRPAEARAEFEECIRLSDQAGYVEGAMTASIDLARLEVADSDLGEGEARLLEVLASRGELVGPRRLFIILLVLSETAERRSDVRRAGRLAGTAAHIVEDFGIRTGNRMVSDRQEAIRKLPGGPSALEEGRRMGLERGIDYALGRSETPAAAERGERRPLDLTKRQLVVARMVAMGLTNKEIARDLWISERTAEGHVEQIRNKLGVGTRSQVASWYASEVGVDND